MTVYTVGLWRVHPGREDDFVRAWNAFAAATLAEFPAASGTLLRDRDDPHLFISFGPWDSPEQVAQWRSSEAFVTGLASMRDLLESFAPHTMDLTTQVG